MDIEDDIKKIKNLIERCKKCKFATCEQCEINWTEVQAIERILAEREEDKKYTIYLTDEQYRKTIENAQKDVEDKYKEKIEELEAKLEFKEWGDLDNLKFEEYMKEFIPKQKVIDKIEKRKKNCTVINSFVIEALEELLEEN